MSEQSSFFHYLPVSQTAMAWGTYLIGAGREVVGPGQPYPPKRHPALYNFNWQRGRTLPEFQILLVNEGRGTFESEEVGKVTLEDSVLLFIFPGVWHRYRPEPETGWTERWISFNGELAHRFFKYQHVNPAKSVAKLLPAEEKRLVRRFDDLLNRIHTHPAQNSLLLSLHAMSLVADAVEQIVPQPSGLGPEELGNPGGIDDPVVIKALEIIWTQSHRPLSVGEVARALPVTRRTLDRRFVGATGRTVLDEINLCRLTRAKRLLRETDLPIKAVAHLAGFGSQERMRVSFIASEAVSPTEYRAQRGNSSI